MAVEAPDIVATEEEAKQLDLPPLIIRENLERHLAERLPADKGEVELERIGEGHSNITYLVSRGRDRVVLRRPPRGPLPPSAHDVLREWRLLDAIKDAEVRTPRTLLACDDEAVIGAPFYIMEYVEGTVVIDELPPELDTVEQRQRLGLDLVDALAEMHAVDWRACGLEGFGKPTGYLERQLRRFTGLWEYNKTRELPRVQEMGEWLARNIPESPPATIVHGDYRLGNTSVANDAPARVNAIFDWEMATIGDPLADLAYLTVTWVESGDAGDTMFSSLSAVTRRDGFPNREELIAHYEERTGRSMSDLRWYQALALWKAAVFMEGNYKRSLAGTTDDPFLKLFDEGVPRLAEAAHQIAHGDGQGSAA
jgi:aminoglycoside phosphotransferase (APT) family kinase protein